MGWIKVISCKRFKNSATSGTPSSSPRSPANRRRLFQVGANARLLLNTLQHYRQQGLYKLHAFVVTPDHCQRRHGRKRNRLSYLGDEQASCTVSIPPTNIGTPKNGKKKTALQLGIALPNA